MKCVVAANRVIADLSALGVDALVFGSLADRQAHFREDSDIDVCILKNPGVDFSLIEEIARGHTKPASLDLFALSELKPEIQLNIIRNGVRHVE